MADGSKRPFPSVYEKISAFQSPLHPPCHDQSASLQHVSPLSSRILVEAPLEKGKKSAEHRLAERVLREVAAATMLAPIERVQSLIQYQNEMLKTGRLSEPYKGISDCVARTVKNEGLLSLWRGNSAGIVKKVFVSPISRIVLWHWFVTKGVSLSYTERKEDSYRFARKLAANSAFIVSVNLFVYPLEYAYVRLATDIKAVSTKGGYTNGSSYDGFGHFTLDSAKTCLAKRSHSGERQFKGLFDVYEKTIKCEGVGGVYRGLCCSCTADILFGALYLAAFDSVTKSVMQRDNDKQAPKGLVFRAGLLGGVICAYYPFYTIRGRMMMTSGEAGKYKGEWGALRQIVKNEGAKSLFKGFNVYLLLAPATFVVDFYMRPYRLSKKKAQKKLE